VVKGVGPRTEAVLGQMGLVTVRDLLFHAPVRYEDRRHVVAVSDLAEGETAVILATVAHARSGRTRSRIALVEARLEDETGSVRAVWFRQPWLARILQPGVRAFFRGKLTVKGSKRFLSSPEVEVVPGEGDRDPERFGTLVPVYPLATVMGGGRLRALIGAAVERFAHDVPEILGERDRERYEAGGVSQALLALHRPESPEAAAGARRRLALEEAYGLQAALLLLRRALARRRTPLDPIPQRVRARILAALPFILTPGQERAVEEILADLRRPAPMHRLLQGDVGCGKTAVAASVALAVAAGGEQSAFLAPTEILAWQHARSLQGLLDRFSPGQEVALLTGSTRARERKSILAGIKEGRHPILVGTHALLSPEVRFAGLRLLVVDEQQRFGVRQRLEARPEGRSVDVLVMTATPIPRSLALTLFADLDHTIIPDRPAGTGRVLTRRVPRSKIAALLRFLGKRIEQGERAYVVCPLVEESEVLDLRAAVETAKKLGEGPLGGHGIGLLHGRLDDAEKREVLESFRRGDVKILVSTLVVEVGVDVQEATVMVVLDADRFGLAQLHQLRGRVGRGSRPGYCFLLPTPGGDGKERLAVLESCSDGFRIAEEDLRLRGVGSLLGLAQHGLCDLQFVDPIRDIEMVAEVRRSVTRRLEEDPRLQAKENRGLRDTVLAILRKGGLDYLRVG
jgi:ATP-dependent DNA helicase RecG